ncbi:MAG TPA: class I SAM-dependent methyltransferase [Vicinamibacterales bacterium]|nr:class I SAM-dependent methyltransferase [Vicinamibacterales bacterium]
MNARSIFRLLILLVIVSLPALAFAQATQTQTKPQTQTQKPFEPVVGQAGKDVVWVPTSQALVDKMLDMAKVTLQDFVMDLGSGDGRTVITAAKRGAHAMGIEYNPDMVELSKKNAAAAGVTDRATFQKADLFETDFSKAQVITMFLLPSINMKLRPKLLDLKPGTRIVSNSFTMEDWEADQTETITGECSSWCTALLWIVPAKVEGTWQVGSDQLTLKQEFQKVKGTLGSHDIEGRLRGDEITFSVGNAKYTGRVDGNTIKGTITGGSGGTFTATRTATRR